MLVPIVFVLFLFLIWFTDPTKQRCRGTKENADACAANAYKCRLWEERRGIERDREWGRERYRDGLNTRMGELSEHLLEEWRYAEAAWSCGVNLLVHLHICVCEAQVTNDGDAAILWFP